MAGYHRPNLRLLNGEYPRPSPVVHIRKDRAAYEEEAARAAIWRGKIVPAAPVLNQAKQNSASLPLEGHPPTDNGLEVEVPNTMAPARTRLAAYKMFEDFHLLEEMPPELEAMVWKEALPEPRIIMITVASTGISNIRLRRRLRVHSDIPALLTTSPASRNVGLKRYKTFGKFVFPHPIYIDFERDILCFTDHQTMRIFLQHQWSTRDRRSINYDVRKVMVCGSDAAIHTVYQDLTNFRGLKLLYLEHGESRGYLNAIETTILAAVTFTFGRVNSPLVTVFNSAAAKAFRERYSVKTLPANLSHPHIYKVLKALKNIFVSLRPKKAERSFEARFEMDASGLGSYQIISRQD